ncbi:hypothetical protein GGI03_008958 [Coemansia sp. RSA 2337]|nr:hypothetical protein GGI08_005067 [Coemansia sp. S2]KAJ2063434.1 hypothetical protein GGH13_006299 [Coemansia sp. S155-1]KAJ2341422.1 hypothetical protein GGH92_005815 [Coemansia sp. RSA 2673]KAJ2418522.1 hypothetical protein GGF41_005014 [Coemansia sp. RSA 2531]KAJ2438735.1 hypothetical protein GGI03_008958 [Coemansia sp. RSA 2337]
MSEQDNIAIIAEGLQRQLDELREIIQQGHTDGSQQQQQQATQPSTVSDNREQEIEKLRIRVEHLVRALDAKDLTIQQLRAQLGQK